MENTHHQLLAKLKVLVDRSVLAVIVQAVIQINCWEFRLRKLKRTVIVSVDTSDKLTLLLRCAWHSHF